MTQEGLSCPSSPKPALLQEAPHFLPTMWGRGGVHETMERIPLRFYGEFRIFELGALDCRHTWLSIILSAPSSVKNSQYPNVSWLACFLLSARNSCISNGIVWGGMYDAPRNAKPRKCSGYKLASRDAAFVPLHTIIKLLAEPARIFVAGKRTNHALLLSLYQCAALRASR